MTTIPNERLRTPLAVTLSVWKALFLRETVTRLSSGRGATVWLLGEPILHVVIMLIIFTVIRIKVVSGIDVLAWLIVGLTFISVFKRTSSQLQNAINANRTLFGYRQVKPVDTLLTRAFLEGFLALLVIIITSVGAIFLMDVDLIPDDLGIMLIAFFGLWLMGLGYGLICSVATELIPELGKIIGMLGMPIYITSGAIFPLHNIPQPYLGWVLYNPLVHGLEIARLGVSPYYHVIHGTNLMYLFQCALVSIFFGLALQIRFARRILTK